MVIELKVCLSTFLKISQWFAMIAGVPLTIPGTAPPDNYLLRIRTCPVMNSPHVEPDPALRSGKPKRHLRVVGMCPH